MFQLWYFQQPPQTIGPEIGPTIAIKGLTNFRHHLAYHTRTLSKISIACLPKTEMTHSLDELVTKLSLLSLQVRNWSRLTISGHAVFLNVSQTLFMVCSSWSFSDHNPFSCYLFVWSFAEVRPTYRSEYLQTSFMIDSVIFYWLHTYLRGLFQERSHPPDDLVFPVWSVVRDLTMTHR